MMTFAHSLDPEETLQNGGYHLDQICLDPNCVTPKIIYWHFYFYEICQRFKAYEYFNPFTAKFKNVFWDYFHVQYYTSFKESKNRINQKYLLAYENGLNTTEKSAVLAQTPPFKGGV